LNSDTYSRAIVRKPGANFFQGVTSAELGIPDFDLMIQQHQEYTHTLRNLGLEVILLDALPDYPDAYFVEDTAVITPEVAVITNPGAQSRRGETAFIEPTLAKFRPLRHITPPGTLDGGDVLAAGKHFFIGLSERTNRAGAGQLGRFLESYDYTWSTVEVISGLHLKSFVTHLGKGRLLLHQTYANRSEFLDYQKIVLMENDYAAANSLLINGAILMPNGFPGVREKLEALGSPIIELDMSESRKMDGGLTCMSLRF
jgi:dimethylargininase